MTDETGAPASAESAPAPVVMAGTLEGGDFSAADALASYRKKTSDNSSAESAAPATAEAESAVEAGAAPPQEATGETQEIDPAPEPPLDLPRSWTKDQADHWNALPRATQEYLTERASKDSEAVRRVQNEAAEKLKGLTAREQAAEQAKAQYEAQLPALMQTLQDAQQAAFSDIRTVDDVTKLAAEDPFRYLQWQAHQTKLQAVHSENERVREDKTRAEQTEWTNHVQKENQLAAEYIPDLADKVKGPALTSRAAERLSELGFKPDELADLAVGRQKLSIYDHRIQRLIFSDLKLSDIQKATAKAVAKPVPQVQRPGVARAPGAASADTIQASRNKLNSTGSVEDAFALYRAKRAGA